MTSLKMDVLKFIIGKNYVFMKWLSFEAEYFFFFYSTCKETLEPSFSKS